MIISRYQLSQWVGPVGQLFIFIFRLQTFYNLYGPTSRKFKISSKTHFCFLWPARFASKILFFVFYSGLVSLAKFLTIYQLNRHKIIQCSNEPMLSALLLTCYMSVILFIKHVNFQSMQ